MTCRICRSLNLSRCSVRGACTQQGLASISLCQIFEYKGSHISKSWLILLVMLHGFESHYTSLTPKPLCQKCLYLPQKVIRRYCSRNCGRAELNDMWVSSVAWLVHQKIQLVFGCLAVTLFRRCMTREDVYFTNSTNSLYMARHMP